MKKFIVIILAIILIRFAFNYFFAEKISEDEKIVNKITAATAKEIYRKLGLRCGGTGGSMMYDVKSLFMGFSSKKPLEVDSGRRLIVECIQIYLKNINDSEEIRPFLHNYPFDVNNVEISIFGPHEVNDPKYLSYVTNMDHKICYEIDVGKNKLTKTVHSETFEEALKIIQTEKELAK